MDLIVCHQVPLSLLKRRASSEIDYFRPFQRTREPSVTAFNSIDSSPNQNKPTTGPSVAASKSIKSSPDKMSHPWGRFDPSPITYAVSKGDAFVAIWASGLEEKVMKLVRKVPNWVAVDVVRRGLSAKAGENPITISITISKPPAGTEWDVLASEVRAVCHETGRADVMVQIEEGRVMRWNEMDTGTSLTIPYPTRPSPCTSVGLKGGRDGTMGGYVEIIRPGEDKPEIAGLTCHHVAFPETAETTGTHIPSFDWRSASSVNSQRSVCRSLPK